MRYRFEITFVSERLIKLNESITALDPAFSEISTVDVLELIYPPERSLDDIKQNIIWSYQADGHKVFKIEGGIVE